MRFFIILCVVLCCYFCTHSCWSNEDCPPYQQCSMVDDNEVCNYLNPCVCSNGVLSIVTGENCPTSFTCQDTPCTSVIGSCQYDGNMG